MHGRPHGISSARREELMIEKLIIVMWAIMLVVGFWEIAQHRTIHRPPALYTIYNG